MTASISPQNPLDPVAAAIEFLVANAKDQPSLDELAAQVDLSPAHFQRLFKAGAGVSPKKFLQYLTAGRARDALHRGQSVMMAAYGAGLSGPSRLHDLTLVSDAMTPGSVRQRGEGVHIRYGRVAGPFGMAMIGVTDKGICWLSFDDLNTETPSDREVAELRSEWPRAQMSHDRGAIEPVAAQIADYLISVRTNDDNTKKPRTPLRLHVNGTNFQLKVWEALLRIPFGGCVTYGDVAKALGKPSASRAVGSAVGANPISVLIPCHRVIRASGALQNYRWGAARKDTLLALEAAAIAS
ncbi:MAG: methylated-DNA--[protein]-cysteine S-methyltransferase [Pseudomonadota bacterium]